MQTCGQPSFSGAFVTAFLRDHDLRCASMPDADAINEVWSFWMTFKRPLALVNDAGPSRLGFEHFDTGM